MADGWYYARDGEKLGPFSATQLKELAATGRLRPHDTVWKHGVEKGVPASRVKHLFSAPLLAALPSAPVAQAGPRISASLVPMPLTASVSPTSSPVELDVPDDVALVPLESAPATEPDSVDEPLPERREPTPRQQEARKFRVLGVQGGTIVSQDGEVMRYRKRCSVCCHADASVTTARLRPGTTRGQYFCPKCKKSRQVEIQVVG